ncbi:hypothetical protein JCM15519_36240 [Fundidesulfovibrio butyratiphilus]
MLGLEKRIAAVRQMCGAGPGDPEKGGKDGKGPGSAAFVLAMVAIIVALVTYFALDNRYSAKLEALTANYEARLGVLEDKIAAPQELAKKILVKNALTEVSQKLDQVKGLVPADQQAKVAKVVDMVKALQQESGK